MAKRNAALVLSSTVYSPTDGRLPWRSPRNDWLMVAMTSATMIDTAVKQYSAHR